MISRKAECAEDVTDQVDCLMARIGPLNNTQEIKINASYDSKSDATFWKSPVVLELVTEVRICCLPLLRFILPIAGGPL